MSANKPQHGFNVSPGDGSSLIDRIRRLATLFQEQLGSSEKALQDIQKKYQELSNKNQKEVQRIREFAESIEGERIKTRKAEGALGIFRTAYVELNDAKMALIQQQKFMSAEVLIKEAKQKFIETWKKFHGTAKDEWLDGKVFEKHAPCDENTDFK